MAGTTRAGRTGVAALLVLVLVAQCAKTAEVFECDGGAVRLPASAVDDDYCDCADGSDEPHTAACSRGHFVCANAGYLPQRVPSAFVNDGVCDCCDGSDEGAAPGTCNNTCAALAAARRTALHAQRAAAEAGLALQGTWARRGAEARAHAVARSPVLAALLTRVRATRDAVVDAEKRLGRGLPRSAVVVVRAGGPGAANDTDADAVAVEVAEGVHVDIEAAEAAVRAEIEKEEKEKEEMKAKEEVANVAGCRAVAEKAWTHGKRAAVHAWEWVLCKVVRRDEACRALEDREDAEDSDAHAGYSEALRCIDDYKSELEGERDALQKLTQLALDDTPCYYVVAQECSEEMMPTFVIPIFFIPSHPLCHHHTCFSFPYQRDHNNRGMFKACPFNNVSMAHRTLGRWQKPASGSSLTETMEFANGDYTWDCPKRTGRLQFVCGDANKLVSMQEPTKCTFEGVFATPCACTQQLIDNITAELALLSPEN